MSLSSWLADPFIIRNLTYGVEDSLVSTTGVLAGIHYAGVPRSVLLMTGIILILVEATSMSYGAFIAEDSFLQAAKESHSVARVLLYAAVMLVSYVVAGMIPMLPFIFEWKQPVTISIALAVLSLFILIVSFQRNIYKAFILTFCGLVVMFISVQIGKVLDKNMFEKSSTTDRDPKA